MGTLTLSSYSIRLLIIFSDFVINCGTTALAQAFSSHNLPVYKLVFNTGSQTHGATTPFLFDEDGSDNAGAIKDWFVSFAVHLDPSAERWSGVKTPEWPAYGKNGDVLVVNSTDLDILTDDRFDLGERCAFWRKNGDIAQN